MKQLILTVTRACNLRCTYCPTAKDGWPSLSQADAVTAVRLFAREYGGGAIKLFGGEPLLRPHVVRAAMEAARDEPSIRWVYLSTNGLGLNQEWLDYLRSYPKGILTISLDGRPEDHRAERIAVNSAVPDAYDHVMSIKSLLLKTPRDAFWEAFSILVLSRGAQDLKIEAFFGDLLFERLFNTSFCELQRYPGH